MGNDFFGTNGEKVSTVRKLAKAFKDTNHMAYRELIKSAKLSKEMSQKLFKKNDKPDLPKEIKHQEEMIELIKEAIIEKEAAEIALDRQRQELEERIAELETKLSALKETFAQMNQLMSKINEDEAILQQEFSKQSKKLDKLNRFSLIHPTATLTALDKASATTILVASKTDVEYLGFDRFADLIIDTDEAFVLTLEAIPDDISKMFETKRELKSALAYTELVYKFWAEDKEFDMLYNHEGIKKLIELLNIF